LALSDTRIRDYFNSAMYTGTRVVFSLLMEEDPFTCSQKKLDFVVSQLL